MNANGLLRMVLTLCGRALSPRICTLLYQQMRWRINSGTPKKTFGTVSEHQVGSAAKVPDRFKFFVLAGTMMKLSAAKLPTLFT
ncbi:hypothetical protein [Caballeronia sp. dw_19]|uniref:hypothetical protein n=1 Tax=Caballeronia sp. dw_19 TaxID=2719791 RepID=UPI001BD52BB7|nr:hypothetical protein [Caballeronia sp. dw_19]